MEGVIGKFGVWEKNETGRKLIEMCTEKRLSVGNMFFDKKDIYKFTWASGVDDHKSLLDIIGV